LKSLVKILEESENNITLFLKQLETYQSNHYGMYDTSNLSNEFNKLPNNIKNFLKPNSVKNFYRGCDGLSFKNAISFTDNKSYANTFGTFTIPFSELKSYSGIISTNKIYILCKKLKIKCNIGNDEGEIIVINPKWKNNINLEEYRN